MNLFLLFVSRWWYSATNRYSPERNKFNHDLVWRIMCYQRQGCTKYCFTKFPGYILQLPGVSTGSFSGSSMQCLKGVLKWNKGQITRPVVKEVQVVFSSKVCHSSYHPMLDLFQVQVTCLLSERILHYITRGSVSLCEDVNWCVVSRIAVGQYFKMEQTWVVIKAGLHAKVTKRRLSRDHNEYIFIWYRVTFAFRICKTLILDRS